MFTTAAINTHEDRDVMILDISGAFLHALTKDEVIMLLRGPLAKIMVLIDPKRYPPHVTHTKNRVPMLYIKIQEAVYGQIRPALDLYLKLQGKLEEKDYVLNPCDPCATNTIIDRSQHTVIWHVEDLEYSHKKSCVNRKFATWLGNIYRLKLTVK